MARKVVKMTEAIKVALSASILSGFFNGTDAAQADAAVAKAEGGRLAYLFGFFPNTDATALREACKGLRDTAEKDHGAKSPEHRTASQRAKEVTALWGAWSFAEFKPEGMGYHKAVASAYAALKAKGIRANGAPIPTKDEKEVRVQAGMVAAEYAAAELLKRKLEKEGKPVTEEVLQAERERTRKAIERDGANTMAKAIVRRKGIQFGQWLVEALEATISVAQHEKDEQDKATAEKKAATA